MEEDGHDRYLGSARGEMGDAGLEAREGLGLAAGAFRKQDEDLAAIQRRHQWRDGIPPAARPSLDREDADDVEREAGEQAVAQEIVRGRHRPDPGQEPERKQGDEDEGVEMAVVVRHHHRGAAARQPFAADHMEADPEEDERPHEEREEEKSKQTPHAARHGLSNGDTR